MSDPEKLPDCISTDGDWDKILKDLYGTFRRTFLCTPCPYLFGKPVSCDKRKLDSDLEEGFWHVTSRYSFGKRTFDPERSRRLSWLAVVLRGNVDGLIRFKYCEGSGNFRYYLWLRDLDYVAIFEEKPNVMVLVTAFYIDKARARVDLDRRLAKGTTF